MKIEELRRAAISRAISAIRLPRAEDEKVAQVVRVILADVAERGDEALVELSRRLDWPEANVEGLRVAPEELEAAYLSVDPSLRQALELAVDNCTWFHQHELLADWEERGPQGQRLGIRYRPVRRAGLYVPGGQGSYASSVIMNAVPAKVAGVRELAICTPPARDGSVNRSVLAAAWLLGVNEVYRLGGAQAVGAMAYGTATVPRVDVICGPGNAYVNEAKRQVFGQVGIDSLAGPSEVLVIADTTAKPSWVAADLLAQEEHGSGATAVMLGPSFDFCQDVARQVESLRLGAALGAAPSPGRLFAFYPARGEDFVQLATDLINEYGPEHLELHLEDSRRFLERVENAGAIFLGHYSPTAFGDYVAGSNHVLPTGGSARFASALGVHTFMRRQSVVELNADAAAFLSEPLAKLAESEGFLFHKLSATLRSK